jgi:phage tail P2-like protein
LLDFLPDSIASDPDIIALSLAIDPELQSVGAAIIEAVILPNIANLEDDILDELAWAFNLTDLQVWDNATTASKRTLLSNIFAIRKKSGTRFALDNALGLVAVSSQVIEWWEEGAAPHTYRLRLFADAAPVTLLQLVEIGELVSRFARASQKLSEFAVESNQTSALVLSTVTTIGHFTEISFGGS